MALTFPEEQRSLLAGAAPKASPARQLSPSATKDDGKLASWKRYEGLSRAEKLRLARYGNANDRRLVLRDKDAALHLHVLNNPTLNGRELAALIRAGGVSVAFIRRVTEHAQWMGNASVVEALLHHPQTPINIAVRLVDRVPMQVAKRIAKSGNLRGQIVTLARRRVLRR